MTERSFEPVSYTHLDVYKRQVVMRETIDPANVPTPVKEGYTLAGWYEKNATEPWDFATDVDVYKRQA